MCLSPLCSTSLFYWYLFLCALPHSFSYSSVHLLHPIFCSQNCLSALHQKGWELWTRQRQDIKATTGQPQLWGCPKSAFWHNKLPREGRVSFKQKQKLNQTKCNGSPKPKNSSGDQGIEWGKAFTQLSSYPEVPAEEAPQEAPSTSQAQSVLHHLCSNPSAPLQCFWDPGVGLGSSLLSLSKSAGAAAFQPAFCSHLPLLLQPAASGSQSTMHRGMNASLLSSGNSPWNNSLLKYMMSLPNMIYAPT